MRISNTYFIFRYLARADRSVTQQEAYKWVVDQFNEFHPDVCDLPPAGKNFTHIFKIIFFN